MIKISTIGGKTTFQGEVFAIDPVTKFIVIKSDGKYNIINPKQISEISGDLSSIKTPDLASMGVSLSAIEKRETTAQTQAENRIASLNSNVEEDIQTLFDRINFVYPCKWTGSNITVLDEYIIHGPQYNVVKVINGREGTGFDRVVKILEGERRKLKL